MSLPVTWSIDGDKVGWIVFDDPSGRVNVINPDSLAALGAALDGLAAQTPKAVVAISAKERIFVAGADLRWLAALPDAGAAADVSRRGKALFQRLEDFPAPVVCAIDGACAGGGFEVAMACRWRVASDAPAVRIGLPETGLGTLPGWGGCVRLPRLIGARAAIDHLLKAQLVPAAEALRQGLVDEIAPAAELRARAKAAALGLAAGGGSVRTAPPETPPGFFADLRRRTLARTRGTPAAPLRAIDVVEQGGGLPPEQAMEIETRAFAELTAGAEFRNLVRVFFLKEEARKRTLDGWYSAGPTGGRAARPPVGPAGGRIGVVGAGVMGSGIAQLAAAAGFDVVMRDVRPEFVERGAGVIRSLFDDAVRRGRMTAAAAAAAAARISATTGWEGFESCDLVVEAIVEDTAAKRALFSELAAVARPDAILASNTSALPIERIAGHVPRPERTLGLHFFNPVGRMALLEMVLAPATGPDEARRALDFVKALGKSPVICRSSPGFLVTRVLFFYLNEAIRLWEEGAPAGDIDEAMRAFGWPMGPLRLIDEVGIDVTDFIIGEMARDFPGRFRPTRACAGLLAAGLKGRKNGAGAGFYAYSEGTERLNPAAEDAVGGPRGPGAAALRHGDIRDRLMAVMVAEARLCLSEGVVRSRDDIDFAMIAGTGFPAFRGGLMQFADTLSD